MSFRHPLRKDDRDTAALATKLRLLDPEDHLGASVVETLLRQSA